MTNSRIPSLDGLRALAIGLVLLDHGTHADLYAPWSSWFWLTFGHVGVLLFFSLSGFLITSLLLREDPISVPKFYVRRVWRIFPPLYCYLLVVTALHHSQFSWLDISLSWTFLASIGQAFVDTFPWPYGHLWSLSVEEQFYLLWPLLLALGLTSARYAAWAAIILAPLFRLTMAKYDQANAAMFAFPGVMDSVAAGCLIALHAGPLTRWVTKHRRWLGILWPLAFLSPMLIVMGNNVSLLWPLPQLLGHLAWTIFNFSVALGILWAIIAQPRILNCRFAVWLGTISYSLYLWHMPFCNPALGIKFPVNLLFAFGAALVSFHLIEQPFLELRAALKNLQPQPRRSTTVDNACA